MKHDFSNEWHEFKDSENKTEMTLEIRKEHFPYFVQGKTIKSESIEIVNEKGEKIETRPITKIVEGLPTNIVLPAEKLKNRDEVF